MTFSSFCPDFFENFSIKEIGLKLNRSEKLSIKKRLSLLEQKAPSSSTISLSYKKSRGEVDEKTVELTILGADHKFFSRTSGPDPYEMYLKVEREIEEQLLNWKEKRFLDKDIEVKHKKDRLQLQEVY